VVNQVGNDKTHDAGKPALDQQSFDVFHRVALRWFGKIEKSQSPWKLSCPGGHTVNSSLRWRVKRDHA